MKIVTWNVNGVRAVTQKDFFSDIISLDPDVLCLQETKAKDHEAEEALQPLLKDYEGCFSHADQKGYSGTAVLSKVKPLSQKEGIGHAIHDSEGRTITVEFDDFYLVNVYVPNSGQGLNRLEYRAQWDTDFLAFLKKLEESKPVIACGDFNVAHQAIDLKNDKANYNKTAGYTQTEIDGMTRFLENGFTDVFRKRYPETIAYTYWSYRFSARKKNIGWRLDYFLVSNSLTEKIKDITIHDSIMGSDHCPVSLDISL